MRKNFKKPNGYEVAAEVSAMMEDKISVQDLLQEIEPLFKEYFIGEFNISDNVVDIVFMNGQKFKLAITCCDY